MEFLRRYWYQIRASLTEMPATTRWLVGLIVVVLLMTAGFVMIFAGKPTMVPVSQFAVDKQADVVAKLKAANIDVQVTGGQVLVPEARQMDALAVLQQNQLMSADFSSAFEEMAAKRSMFETAHDKDQALLQAKMKMSGQVIAHMAGVQSAQVMITPPQNSGFGATHVRPAASVAVIMRPGRRVEQPLVEAVAGWVCGAVAEMQPQDVTVIDTNMGRQFRVHNPDDATPDDVLRQQEVVERYHRDKIIETLGYIPGVIVAVNVRPDTTIHTDTVDTTYNPKSVPSKESTSETSSTTTSSTGGTGVQANVGIANAGTGGPTNTQTTSTIETENFAPQVVKVVNSRATGEGARQINVTINVPRSFFVGVFKQGKPADAKDPDDAALALIAKDQLKSIESQIEPLIAGTQMSGLIRASMVPDAGAMMMMHDPGLLVGGAGVGSLMMGDWIKPVGLGVLGLMSLVLMFGMVRKATHQQSLPSIQELAGVPPTLAPVEDDLVGEAEEAEAGMAGIELNDDQIRSRKMAEQIGDLVKSNPSEAAGLFHRWIRKDE